MKGYLGEFEELVLLTIANLAKDAYGVAILNDISKRANRKLSIGALHSTLTRLEEKDYITSSTLICWFTQVGSDVVFFLKPG
ncbi:MAG: hypothetical protein AAFY41_05540 [Bacteroidota bacterium]